MEASNGYWLLQLRQQNSGLPRWLVFQIAKAIPNITESIFAVCAMICDGEPSNKWTLPW